MCFNCGMQVPKALVCIKTGVNIELYGDPRAFEVLNHSRH